MKLKKYLPYAAGILILIIYLFTLAPSVIQIDSGELTTVQILAGIAHPTGYPLFTIIGYLWALIPLPLRDVVQMNLLAALFCSAAVMVFIKTALAVFNSRDALNFKKAVKARGKKKQKEQPEKKSVIPEIYIYIAAVSGGLMLAFSRTFWFQSTSVEVYSLHLLLIMLIIHSLIKAYLQGTEEIFDRRWLIFSIFLAFGFTNHMTTLLILPGTAYLYFLKYRFGKKSWLRLLFMIFLFIIILTAVYSYLPLRGSANPVLNWGNPVDMERIFRHIMGKQYQVWLFSSADSAKKQLDYFFTNLPSEFYFSLAAALAGIVLSFNYIRKFSIFLIISFVSTVLYSVNYDITDIDSYFLLAYITLAFFSAIAIVKALIYFYPEGKGFKTGIFVTGILILLQIYLNYGKVDQSGNYVYEDYTKSILKSTSKNSVILSYQWDYFISPAIYFQFIEGYRKDIPVIDKELLRRSWYFNQIERNYPGVLGGVKTEVGLFLDALKPFERDQQYNAGLLENLYRKIITGIISTNIDKRDIYIAPELIENEMQKGEFILPEGYKIVPDLLLFKVVKGEMYIPAADPDFTIRLPEEKDRYSAFIERAAGSMLARRAIYEIQNDKKDRAVVYINKIRKDFPEYPVPPELMAVIK